MLGTGPTAVLYAITDAIVDHYLEVADELQTDLEELEAEVFSPDGGGSRNTASRIYTFKRQMLEFRRATGPLAAPLTRLAGWASAGVPFVHEQARPFFRDVNDHLTRVNESGGGPGPAAVGHPVGASRADERAAERRHAEDLRVGGDGGGPHDDRGDLRHELRPHAGAALGVGVSGGDRADGRAWTCCCTGCSSGAAGCERRRPRTGSGELGRRRSARAAQRVAPLGHPQGRPCGASRRAARTRTRRGCPPRARRPWASDQPRMRPMWAITARLTSR